MKELIILGCGPTKRQCPIETDIPIWSVNNGYRLYEGKVDKLFIVDEITEREFDFDELREIPAIVAPEYHPAFSNIEVYPIDAILERFKTEFFSNAICYMVALAIYEGYERIYFYGIDMMTFDSYVMEKGGVEYWMGIAHALGVEIINTADSCTGKTCDGRMYGIWGRGQECTNNDEIADQVREMVAHIPHLWDESLEWVQDENGNWDRRPQRLIQYRYFEEITNPDFSIIFDQPEILPEESVEV